MQRPGLGPQGLRAMPGNVFSNQPNTTNRQTPLGSGRLQNGKLAGGNVNAAASWGFGGLPSGIGSNALSGNPQSRASGGPAGGLASFAQTIGGGNNQPPIDLSDFPSLSGSSQQQHQQHTQAQSLWANPTIRATQQTPIQRQPQGQGAQQQTQHQQGASNAQQHGQDEGSYDHGNNDDYGFGGQGTHGGLPGLSGLGQPQTSNVEEFPPLGGLGSVDANQDRRTGLIQNAAFGGGGGGQAGRFGPMGQGRLGLTSPDGQLEGGSLRLGGQRIPSAEEGRNVGLQRAAPGFDHAAQQLMGQAANSEQAFARSAGDGDALNSLNSQLPSQPGRKRLAEMPELDRWGIQGLLAMIPSDSPDHSSLAVGQDLTVLGLDLNRPDNSPLYPTFGTPFGDHSSNDPNAPPRPVVPDFEKHIPASYAVTNVPPLGSKISSFHEETLFAIFYTYTRDIMQEHAAAELYQRDWRWHKELRQWMMKDPNPPPGWPSQPQQIDAKRERGFYVFFDVNSWRKERRELILSYDALDQRHGNFSQPQPGL